MIRRSSLLFVAFALALAGCQGSVQTRAQVATQTTLTALAEAVVVVNQDVHARLGPAHLAAVHEVQEQCPAPCPDWEARYDAELEPLTQVREVNRNLAAALHLTQSLLSLWIHEGALPATWASRCHDLAEAAGALLGVLQTAGIDVPEALSGNCAPVIEATCRLVVEVAR